MFEPPPWYVLADALYREGWRADPERLNWLVDPGREPGLQNMPLEYNMLQLLVERTYETLKYIGAQRDAAEAKRREMTDSGDGKGGE